MSKLAGITHGVSTPWNVKLPNLAMVMVHVIVEVRSPSWQLHWDGK